MTLFEIRSSNICYKLKLILFLKQLKVIMLVTGSNKINVVTFNFIHFQILILKINLLFFFE